MNYRRSSNATAVAIFTCMALSVGLEADGTQASVKDFAAVRGDRTAGRLLQIRSEVLARAPHRMLARARIARIT
jgi:hypothetical protein